jgi:hypothetical protein
VKSIFARLDTKKAKKTVDGFLELRNDLEKEIICITDVDKNVFLFKLYKAFDSNATAIEFCKDVKFVSHRVL